jgi:hypothetical protein
MHAYLRDAFGEAKCVYIFVSIPVSGQDRVYTFF